MKISIITVCYNEEKNIAKTIESVLNQTSNSFEYIICDGNSKDRTVEIAESYTEKFKNKGIEYRLYSEKDGGIYFGMNNGIDRASGDYIIFTNAGDKLYDEEVISKIIEKVGDNTPAVIYGNCLFVDRCVGVIYNADHTKLSEYMSIAHPATLVRTDIIKQNKFDTSFKIAADYNMMLDLYNKNYEFFKLQTVISQFQTDGISSTNFEASIKEAGRAKLTHGYAYDEEKEISAAAEGANRKRRKLPKFVRKFWNKNIKKRLWIED